MEKIKSCVNLIEPILKVMKDLKLLEIDYVEIIAGYKVHELSKRLEKFELKSTHEEFGKILEKQYSFNLYDLTKCKIFYIQADRVSIKDSIGAEEMTILKPESYCRPSGGVIDPITACKVLACSHSDRSFWDRLFIQKVRNLFNMFGIDEMYVKEEIRDASSLYSPYYIDQELKLDLKSYDEVKMYSLYMSSLSSGQIQILPLIILYGISETGDIVLIEEPEIHLHSQDIIKVVTELFTRYLKNGMQLIITTHNPILLYTLPLMINKLKEEELFRHVRGMRLYRYMRLNVMLKDIRMLRG